MLKKSQRFRGPNSSRPLQRSGRTFRHEKLSLRVKPASGADSRLAVVVSKKVNKRAVVRNRIRRRVFEFMRINWGSINEPIDFSIAVFDDSFARISSDEFNKEITILLEKSSFFKFS